MQAFHGFLRPVVAGVLMGLFSGCAVNTYHTSNGNLDVLTLTAAAKYSIVNADTVALTAFDDNGQMPAVEMNLLSLSLKNRPGNSFGSGWNQAMPPLDNAYGYLNIHTDDTNGVRLASRSANPMLFDESSDSIPVQIKTVMVAGTESYSAGWMTAYLLSLTMAPMKKYNSGALVVAVLDKNGMTIGTKVVGFQHAEWFSGLFPTALFAGGDVVADGAGCRSMELDERNMRNQLVVQAAAMILTGRGDAVAEPRWNNIRAAVVEALAVGNTDGAEHLLNAAAKENLGGTERRGWAGLW